MIPSEQTNKQKTKKNRRRDALRVVVVVVVVVWRRGVVRGLHGVWDSEVF